MLHAPVAFGLPSFIRRNCGAPVRKRVLTQQCTEASSPPVFSALRTLLARIGLTAMSAMSKKVPTELAEKVDRIVSETPVYDVHTHLYDPAFGPLLLWGIDDLLVYHYLVAEAFRHLELPYEKFWNLSKTRQAELIW